MRAALVIIAGLFFSAAHASSAIQPVTFEKWNQTLADARGEIVVVDFWATWCDSCIKRFPHMVDMEKGFREDGVLFVSMLLEDPEEPGVVEMAQGFLDRQSIEDDANFAHYRMDENLMAAFETLDLIGIPAVFIYDREGNLAHRLTGDDPNNQFTEEDIEVALEGMLGR